MSCKRAAEDNVETLNVAVNVGERKNDSDHELDSWDICESERECSDTDRQRQSTDLTLDSREWGSGSRTGLWQDGD